MRTPISVVTFCFCCFVFSAHAQGDVKDSLRYYQRQAGRIIHDAIKQARESDSVKYYAKQYDRVKRASREYTSFALFTEATSADFRTFNSAILKDGFGPMSNAPMWRLGVGISHKGYSGVMVDFNYLIIGFNRSVANAGSKITANCLDLLQLQLGYAVINGHRFNLYPFAGLGLRGTSLNYDAPTSVNNSYNSIASIVQNNRSTGGSSTHAGYQAGIGIDWVIHENEKSHGGTMLFGKFGTNGIFGDEDYKIAGVDYHSGIKYGAWAAQLGFKFFGR